MKNIYTYITIIFVTTYPFTLSAGSTSMIFNDLQSLDTVELLIGDGDSYCLSSRAIQTEAKYVLNSANIKISKAADVYVEIITNYERINNRDACYGYIGVNLKTIGIAINGNSYWVEYFTTGMVFIAPNPKNDISQNLNQLLKQVVNYIYEKR